VSGVAAAILVVAPCLAQDRWPRDPEGQHVDHGAEAAVSCDGTTPVLMPPDSLGPLKPRLTLAELQRWCTGLEYRWLWLEGMPQPVLVTRLGEMSIMIEMTDTLAASRIYRVSTSSPSARTLDGIGPGVSLGYVRDRWPDLKIAFGEGVFALSDSHPGISLGLAIPEDADRGPFRLAERSGDLRGLPAEATVWLVLLTHW